MRLEPNAAGEWRATPNEHVPGEKGRRVAPHPSGWFGRNASIPRR